MRKEDVKGLTKYLQRIKMSIKEILSHAITLIQLSTHTRRAQTTPDSIPFIRALNSSSKPTREIRSVIFQISPAWFKMT